MCCFTVFRRILAQYIKTKFLVLLLHDKGLFKITIIIYIYIYILFICASIGSLVMYFTYNKHMYIGTHLTVDGD